MGLLDEGLVSYLIWFVFWGACTLMNVGVRKTAGQVTVGVALFSLVMNEVMGMIHTVYRTLICTHLFAQCISIIDNTSKVSAVSCLRLL